MQYKGIEYLRNKLECKRLKVNTRYKFYDMKNQVLDFGISTPPELRYFQNCIGWCGKAVDSIADRLTVNGFDESKDLFNIDEIFRLNNPDVFFDSAIVSALIGSCAFVYIYADDSGYPRLQVIDGSNATGEIDPITNLLTEGYAVLQRDDSDNPLLEAYFIAGKTYFIFPNEKDNYSVDNNVAYPLLVPIIYKPDAKRPFGHSRITRACMDIMNSAIRTIKRSEIAAEFYSYPQKYVTGLSEDAELMDKWKATMSSMITFTKDEDGDHPIVGQFTTQSMSPHLEQLKMFASLFGGETGLTLDDLGFASGNPSSFEAIKAQHENLRLTAKKAQKYFSSGFLNVGMVAACLRDNFDYKRKAFYDNKLIWGPVFEPDSSALAGIGDAAIKLNQAIPNYLDENKISELTGI